MMLNALIFCFRYDDLYDISMTFKDGKTHQTREVKLSKSVADVFDENGTLCSDIFAPEIKKLHSNLSSKKEE